MFLGSFNIAFLEEKPHRTAVICVLICLLCPFLRLKTDSNVFRFGLMDVKSNMVP